jgi:hypothetical protein
MQTGQASHAVALAQVTGAVNELAGYQMAVLRKAQGDSVGANEYMAKTEKMYTKVEPSYYGKRWLSDKGY